MKRSELITELNRMTLRYNLTWSDIKSDADKAIHQVNNLLGTDYPMLSKIMLSDNSEYSERVDDEDVPIIKDVYFYSVIIPFMAMEILARESSLRSFQSTNKNLCRENFRCSLMSSIMYLIVTNVDVWKVYSFHPTTKERGNHHERKI